MSITSSLHFRLSLFVLFVVRLTRWSIYRLTIFNYDKLVLTSLCQANMQQLWGFNLGYEHHEQKPIYFGAVPEAAARQMQLWGFSMGSEHHEQMPIPFGAKANNPVSITSPQAQVVTLC